MCIGPFRRALHWGPLLALGIIKSITLMCIHCCTMWWPPANSFGGTLNMFVFTVWNALVLYHFFTAMIIGPGYVPLKWKPENPDDVQYLQYCHSCQGYKSPRAHHCRKCKRCVMKMDHHCPWINNCCGHKNHANFTLFLLFAVCGCLHASVILGCALYRALYRQYYKYYGTGQEPVVILSLTSFVCGMFSFGMAIGVIISVGTLFFFQMRGILKNETGIENWIVAKANRPRADDDIFVYPYNLGWKKNLWQVLTDECNGINWPVVEGCHPYSLTIEQIKQKEDKRSRTREYTIIDKYKGSWFPISKGCRVVITIPCSDEARIPLEVGDKVLVTRWKRWWLYGERFPHIQSEENTLINKERHRGWFPRQCAVEIINGDSESHKKIIDQRSKKKD